MCENSVLLVAPFHLASIALLTGVGTGYSVIKFPLVSLTFLVLPRLIVWRFRHEALTEFAVVAIGMPILHAVNRRIVQCKIYIPSIVWWWIEPARKVCTCIERLVLVHIVVLISSMSRRTIMIDRAKVLKLNCRCTYSCIAAVRLWMVSLLILLVETLVDRTAILRSRCLIWGARSSSIVASWSTTGVGRGEGAHWKVWACALIHEWITLTASGRTLIT